MLVEEICQSEFTRLQLEKIGRTHERVYSHILTAPMHTLHPDVHASHSYFVGLCVHYFCPSLCREDWMTVISDLTQVVTCIMLLDLGFYNYQ